MGTLQGWDQGYTYAIFVVRAFFTPLFLMTHDQEDNSSVRIKVSKLATWSRTVETCAR